MAHQITLEELGLITPIRIDRSKYAHKCAKCVCKHCNNNVDCIDENIKSDFACFNCDECLNYTGRGIDKWIGECKNYKITNKYAEQIRKTFVVSTVRS